MDPEVSAAMLRVQRAVDSRDESEVGLKIPILVSAIIDDEADSELLDLVRAAMTASNSPITMIDLVVGVRNLVMWRSSAT